MRARYPDREGDAIAADGVRLHYELFGEGERTILFLPTWSIIHSRHWKAQIPYFARQYRVLTFDGRGNGRSERPLEATAYSDDQFAADALAVMDATQTRTATLVSLSAGGRWALILAALHPERVDSAAFIAPSVPLAPVVGARREALAAFDEPLASYDGWYKFNRHYWETNHREFLEFFFAQCFPEPHSTKQIEDCVAWGLETTPQVLIATSGGVGIDTQRSADLAARVRCPVLVLHGDRDAVVSPERGAALAAATGGKLVSLAGLGHCPQARKPVAVNLELGAFFAGAQAQPPTPRRNGKRPKRALFLSSPIGLGHAQRDVAIASELRRLVPGLEIDWLAQHPVTQVLQARGERIHPGSADLVNESAHITSECAEHDLHCFQAWRRMDEILVANFMRFHEAVNAERYDLWIGDEAWELDYYLHEHPNQKRAPYAWLTDFVGWLPMPDGGEREAFLTGDYNEEMIEHVEGNPGVRDRAIFVGNPDDIVAHRFAPHLPRIADWTQRHFDFAGYVTGFDPAAFADREALRAELGYAPGEKVCIVTVGGSGVGYHLLRRIVEAYPMVKARIPQLRMIVVAGPRIDPAAFADVAGPEVLPYVDRLYRHLAACDIALVQGGLTTTMELTANRRPFIYFPLAHHFEQNFHVRHRLERYRAGRCMQYADATPATIARAVVEELNREPAYRPVESDGAVRAARSIAELL